MRLVYVDYVEPQPGSTVWRAHGRTVAEGHLVTFAGDWRPMRDLLDAIQADQDVPVAEVEPWAILNIEEICKHCRQTRQGNSHQAVPLVPGFHPFEEA